MHSFFSPTSGLHAQDKTLKDPPQGLPENMVTIPTANVEPEVVGAQDWCWGCANIDKAMQYKLSTQSVSTLDFLKFIPLAARCRLGELYGQLGEEDPINYQDGWETCRVRRPCHQKAIWLNLDGTYELSLSPQMKMYKNMHAILPKFLQNEIMFSSVGPT